MRLLTYKEDYFRLKVFIEYDKSTSEIFINHFIEDFKIELKIPLKSKKSNEKPHIILDKFDISNKIFLTNVN